MLINPIVAAASVAARAFGGFVPIAPPDSSRQNDLREPIPSTTSDGPSVSSAIPTQDEDVKGEVEEDEEEVHHLAAELVTDDELPGHRGENYGRRNMPPPLPDTDDPYLLLDIPPHAPFADVRRAYRELVRIYHPDAVLASSEATPEERAMASEDFARINAAFEYLKRREEGAYEYSMYVDGERVTRRQSDDYHRRDRHAIDYDRIREMAEYNRRHPGERYWYEEEYDYEQRVNGFERPFDYSGRDSYDSFSRGRRRWSHTRDDDHGFGHIPSRESAIWGDERHYQAHNNSPREGRRHDRGHDEGVDGGFEVGSRWWNDGLPFEGEQPRGSNDRGYRRMFDDEQPKHGYPYKDTVWNEGHGGFEPTPPSTVPPTRESYGIGYDDRRNEFRGGEKWWRLEDPDGYGGFAP